MEHPFATCPQKNSSINENGIKTNNIKQVNVKISFSLDLPINITNHDNILTYYSSGIYIIKFGIYTCSVMRKKTFVNISGIPNTGTINNCLHEFSLITGVKFGNIQYKIDTITSIFSSVPALRSKFIEYQNDARYCLRIPKKFGGIVISLQNGPVCNYFNGSGKVVLLGAKSTQHIEECYRTFCEIVNDIQ